jgi:uncharacterized membrane protein
LKTVTKLQQSIPPISAQAKSSRLLSLDGLRGFIIVLMALDHANSFIASGKLEPELWADLFPNYLGHPPLTFLTRLVTHLAAPGFFFLMGAGMILLAQSRRRRGWNEWQITRHFLLRGVLLIALQFTLENFAWNLKEPLGIYFGVLYALGGVMIIGTLLLRLPQAWLLILSGSLIIVTELLLPESRTGFESYPVPLRMWLLPGFTGPVLVLYPLMPWFGVTGLGIAYGRLLQQDPAQAYRRAFWLGLAALSLFLPLRHLGGFGNIRPAAGQDWISILNVVKYPPSITFLFLTLGTNLLLLALFSRLPDLILWPLAIFGQVPLFFYISHLFLYGFWGRWIEPAGVGIPRMIPYWLLGLLILWPLCWLYGVFKHSRPPNSVWRFF